MSAGMSPLKGINRFPRVLFFISGMNPNEDEQKQAERFLPNVAFRNAQMVGDNPMSALEGCDCVAGPAIPARYAKTFPNVNDFDPKTMGALSDYYLKHGAPTDPDNEAARAVRPDSATGAGRNPSQGAPTVAGAITTPSSQAGGFLAPQPGQPMPFKGTESADGRPAGSAPVPNPAGLPEGGITASVQGQPVPVSTGLAAQNPPGSGFTNPAGSGTGSAGSGGGSSDGLDELTREELNKTAADRGITDPHSFPNKSALVAAIRSKN